MEIFLIRKQLFIAACLYIGLVLTGYMMGWSAPIIPKLQDLEQTPLPFLITEREASWIGSLVYIGGIIGPYVSGFLSNRKGRKPCLFLGGILSITSFIILALAKNLPMIYTARILSGLGTGMIYVTSLVYIGEISSTHIRGILLTCTGVFGTMGTLLGYVIGPNVPYAATAYVGLAFSIAFGVGVFFIPESPLYLAINGEKTKAEEVLVYLGRISDVDKFLSEKLDELVNQSLSIQWSEVISVKSNRRAITITVSLCVLQQMSGASAVVLFGTTIFELAESSIAPDLATIVIGVIQLGASVTAPMFVEKVGRKTLLLVSLAFCCLSLTVLGIYFYLDFLGYTIVRNFGWLPLVALTMFMLCYCLGFNILPNTFIGEMFTPSVRSTGSTLSITIGWLVGFFMTSAFGAMLAKGAHVPFLVYASCTAFAFLFTVILVPETKGKSLFEIQYMLSR